MMRSFGCLLLATALFLVPQTASSAPREGVGAALAPPPRAKAPAAGESTPKMPLTGLAPAKPMFDACVYKYPVGTTNPQCQAFVDQGLGMYYSYVWMEAARAFETALQHDPDCAYAWLMLSRSLEKWGKPGVTPPVAPYVGLLGGLVYGKLPDRVGKNAIDYSLDTARRLMPKASPRERLLVQSRLQEKGMWPNVGPDERRKKAAQSLDELLMLHEDDEEGWFWRAQLAGADGPNATAVFYKALLRVNPLHPGANHEFVHFYENVQRPALGWPYAENYIKSSPGIPHAHHMQAHLGTRIGKWGETTDWSAKAVELQVAYHKLQDVKPSEDHQFNHHMDIFSRSLIHDGRFAEARAHRTLAESYKYTFRTDWLRMAMGQHDWDEAQRLVEQFRRSDKSSGAYYAALVSLEKFDTEQAGREVDTLRQLSQSKKFDKQLERRLWEVQGRHLCQKGDGEAGLKLLKKIVDATKNEFGHHSWGNGAVYMESWGIGALEAGSATDAEEAFQEALAHDAGSVRGALGLWALCDRLGRSEEAARYLKIAHRVWAKADSRDFTALQNDMARRATKLSRSTATAAGE
ncbi:tetratricopeptide repeat protein [Gemmata palustris]|uniref:tetratricopeptide repeat protein n=1 Tax=Gemmata palustris TaxID=2822762 RepID=UPI001FEB63C7|nr:tetratricopeptide repeat protein [Gemmata palustris]